MTEFTTSSRGDRVAYDRYGNGPALVFVAGAGPFRAIDPITTETAERAAELGVTALVFDRLGRGESQAGGRLDLDRELAAISALIDVVGGAAVLCGHSSGCSISMRAAAEGLPVSGLALWEAPLAGPADETKAWAQQVERHIDDGDTEQAMRHYMKDMPPEWLAEAEASPDWKHVAGSVVTYRADGQSMAWAQRGLDEGHIPEINTPVITMYGTETFPEMPVTAAKIVQALSNATEIQMPGAMHSWEPAPMAAKLASFVKATANR